MTERWEVRQDPKDPNAWDVYCGVQKIAHLPWLQKAHANLIAAAPEMLEALKEIREACCSGMGTLPPGDVERGEAAIRKAEGTK